MLVRLSGRLRNFFLHGLINIQIKYVEGIYQIMNFCCNGPDDHDQSFSKQLQQSKVQRLDNSYIQFKRKQSNYSVASENLNINHYARQRFKYKNPSVQSFTLKDKIADTIFQKFDSKREGPKLLQHVILVGPNLQQIQYNASLWDSTLNFTVNPQISAILGKTDERTNTIGLFVYPNGVTVQKMSLKDASVQEQIDKVIYQSYTTLIKRMSVFTWKNEGFPQNKLMLDLNKYCDLFLVQIQYPQFCISKDGKTIYIYTKKFVWTSRYPNFQVITSMYTAIFNIIKFQRVKLYSKKAQISLLGDFFITQKFKLVADKILDKLYRYRFKLNENLLFQYQQFSWNLFIPKLQNTEDIIAEYLGKGLSRICKLFEFETLIFLISSILNQKKNIMLFSQTSYRLTFTSLFLKLLILPIEYSGIWIFTTPVGMLEGLMQIPSPTVFGVHGTLQSVDNMQIGVDQTMIYNIDKGVFIPQISLQEQQLNSLKLQEPLSFFAPFQKLKELGNQLEKWGFDEQKKQKLLFAQLLKSSKQAWQKSIFQKLDKEDKDIWIDQFRLTQTYQLLNQSRSQDQSILQKSI